MRRDRIGEAFGDAPLHGAHIDRQRGSIAGRVFATVRDECVCHGDGTRARHVEVRHQLDRDCNGDDGGRREGPADTLPLSSDPIDHIVCDEFVETPPFNPERLGNHGRAVPSQIIPT